MLRLIAVVLAAVGLTCCNQAPHYADEFEQLCAAQKKLHIELRTLKDSVGGVWDHINVLLEKKFPDQMTPVEKHNMMQVRNANLIRMFASYDAMDEDLKMAVDNAETMDKTIAERIHTLKQTWRALEFRKMKISEKILQTEGAAALQQYKDKFCPDPESHLHD